MTPCCGVGMDESIRDRPGLQCGDHDWVVTRACGPGLFSPQLFPCRSAMDLSRPPAGPPSWPVLATGSGRGSECDEEEEE